MTFAISVVTLFPDIFPGPLDVSVTARARANDIWSLQTVDLRHFGRGSRRCVDDRPFGGGAGMVLRPDTLADAIDSIAVGGRPRLCLSPRGKTLNQTRIRALAACPGMILVCGRYEGIDQRVIAARALEEVSIGDFLLAGGELAAMALMEAVIRLLPGVTGNPLSTRDESFEDGLLEHPHFTRPRSWEERAVPDVLFSGNHQEIAQWRRNTAVTLTQQRRSDLQHTGDSLRGRDGGGGRDSKDSSN